MALDETDAKIVTLLQGSTRLTNEEIGGKVNLSPTAVAKRRKKLDQGGIFSAQVAVLNLNAVGPFVSALVLCSFEPDGAATVDEFTDAVIGASRGDELLGRDWGRGRDPECYDPHTRRI
jgi:Lrp/AsnC family leucine-responsive transcriptional regulator